MTHKTGVLTSPSAVRCLTRRRNGNGRPAQSQSKPAIPAPQGQRPLSRVKNGRMQCDRGEERETNNEKGMQQRRMQGGWMAGLMEGGTVAAPERRRCKGKEGEQLRFTRSVFTCACE